MDRTMRLLWWAGLLGALVATLVVLKEVALVLRAFRDIDHLAKRTLPAARGIVTNTAPIAGLPALAEPLVRLQRAVDELAAATAALERRLGRAAAGRSR